MFPATSSILDGRMLVDLPVGEPVVASVITPDTVSTTATVLEELAFLAAVVVPIPLLLLAVELPHWLTLLFSAIGQLTCRSSNLRNLRSLKFSHRRHRR